MVTFVRPSTCTVFFRTVTSAPASESPLRGRAMMTSFVSSTKKVPATSWVVLPTTWYGRPPTNIASRLSSTRL